MTQELNPNNEIPAYEYVLPTLSATTEEIHIFLPTATTTTYPIVLNVPFGGTISGLVIQTSSGTATVTVSIAGVSVTGLSAKSVTSTEAEYLATAANSFSVGDDIKIEFTAASSAVNVSVNLQVVRAIPATAETEVTTADGTVLDGTKEENIIYPLSSGVTLYTIPFAVVKTDTSDVATTSYSVFAQNPVENLIDTISLNISGRVVGRASTGLTILLTGSPDSVNYVFRANIKVI